MNGPQRLKRPSLGVKWLFQVSVEIVEEGKDSGCALTVPWLSTWYSEIPPEERRVTKILSAPNSHVQENKR